MEGGQLDILLVGRASRGNDCDIIETIEEQRCYGHDGGPEESH